MTRRLVGTLVLFLLTASSGNRLFAAGWPKIPKSEWELTAFPGIPNAPAVVLLNRGELHFNHEAVSAYFEVYTRIKILNEEGRKYGTVEIPSTKFRRTKSVEARTLLPDGRVVELGKDAKFEKKYSAFYDYSIRSFAMPAVEVGSIIEFRYRRYFDSFSVAEPWYFDSELPTLRSEIECNYPLTLGLAPVKFSPFGREIKEETKRSPKAIHVLYWMENLPPVPDEPSRLPFPDVASWALFLPREYAFSGRIYDFFKDWRATVDVAEGSGKYGYKGARGDASATKSRAKKLAASAASPRARAESLYRFVRDEITTQPYYGVMVGDHSCDQTLKEQQGDYADKALLLQGMLKAIKVDSSLGWVRPRNRGRTQKRIPTPYQFDKILVVAELDGQQVFLDPSDPDLPFGNLPPEMEGIPCLLVDKKKPEWVDTPVTPFQESQRNATLNLAVDDEGIVAGKGRVVFVGHSAWSARRRVRSAQTPEEYWQEWLENRFPAYDITEIKTEAPPEELRLELSWQLSQREEEALGDEVALAMAAPLGVVNNPFILPPGRRRSPVQLRFADVDSVELTLNWPEGWELDSSPRLEPFSNGAGAFEAQVATDPAQRQLKLRRSFTIGLSRFFGSDAYRDLHELYGKAAAGDAEQIVLVRK